MHDTSPPASAPPERRLAAVLFVDLVGYSSLAAEDEQRAMSLLALFHASAREAISACSGTLVKTIGDAAFAEFASTERAVRCALRLRQEFPARARAERIPAQLRIGVHVGDAVTAPDGDLYGDGVNIAARLQREAAPDQVVVSEAVWQQLRQRREYRFQPLGQRLLKGQQEAIRLYAVEPGEAGDAGRRTRRRPWLRARRSAAGLIALGLGLLGLGGLAGWLLRTAAEAPAAGASGTVRLELVLPDDQLIEISGGRSDPFDLSPDGSNLVYVARSGRETRLYLRPLGGFAARALPGTEGAQQPFFSPDGRWVGFFAERSLRKVPIAGGEPITIAGGIPEPAGASWGSRGTIIVAVAGRGLYTVPEDGGDLVEVSGRAGMAPPDPTGVAKWPSFLPDGEHALFDDNNSIWLLTLRTGAVRRLIRGINGRYIRSGHILFSDEDEQVRAVSFDLDRLKVTSSPVPVLDNVFRGPGSGAINLAVSGTGTLVYLSGGFERSLVVVDRNGRATPIGLPPRGYRFPTVSPDGALLAVTVDPRPSDIWIVDLRRETATRLTTAGHNIGTAWSRDGSRLAFHGEGDIVWTHWPAVGEPLTVIELPGNHYVRSWTLDGRILVTHLDPATRRDLVIVDPESETAAPFLATPADEREPVVSPDGRWIAYISDISGADEVYVLPLSGDVAPRLVSVGGGADPVWSPDGGELFYRRARRILAVPWPLPDESDLGRPVELFEAPYDFTQARNWDALPGGRFVMVRADPSTTSRFRVVLNWFAELEPPRQ